MTEKTIALLPEQAPPHALESQARQRAWWDINALDFDHEPGEPTPQFIENVRRCGILVPILVRYSTRGDRPRVLDGVRRCKAARAAGIKVIPIIGAPALDDDVVALIANNNRSPNPRTELAAIERIIKTTGATPKQLARELGIPYGTVKRRMKLRKLSGPARRLFEAGDIAVGVAESMSRLGSREQNRILGEAARDDVPITGRAVNEILQVQEKKAIADLPAAMFNGPGRDAIVTGDPAHPSSEDYVTMRRADLDEVLEYISIHNHADFEANPKADALLARLEEVLNG